MKAVLVSLVLTHAALAGKLGKDVLSWPRSTPDAFGCFVEKTWGHVDKKFNCALKGYVGKGDPCKDTKAYYEGPEFPQSKANAVHPLVERVDVSWEHGSLQSVTFVLKRKASEAAARKLFQLPPKGAPLPANVMDVSVQECGKTSSCVTLQGFDHMGAGDVECGT